MRVHSPGTPPRPRSRIIVRAAIFSALWWILTEGNTDSWIVGVPFVIGATVASCRLRPASPRQWRLGGALRFVVFFLVESLRAGIDVARRAVTMNIAPEMISYPVALTNPPARLLFSGTVSMLPGTLTAELKDGMLLVHTLDARQPVVDELNRLECCVGAMFGETIEHQKHS